MTYTFRVESLGQNSELDLQNCTVSVNRNTYTVQSGVITKTSDDKKEHVSSINLLKYQLTALEQLAATKDSKDRLDEEDLENLSPEEFEKKLNDIYQKTQDMYKVTNVQKEDNEISMDIYEGKTKVSEIKITIPEQSSSFEKFIERTGKYAQSTIQFKNTYIPLIAEKTCVSEDYLRNVLMQEEKCRLRAYDDRVKFNENDEHGTLTVGFGHTGEVSGKYFVGKGYNSDEFYPITPENYKDICLTYEQACELLIEDINQAEKDVKEFIGEDAFNKAPQSIREALIDIVFCKGTKALDPNINPNSLTTKLKEDLENEDYVSAATHVIYDTPVLGLKKRNIVRFVHTVKGLETGEDRKKAKDETENYYKDVISEYNKLIYEAPYTPARWKAQLKAKFIRPQLIHLWNSIDIKSTSSNNNLSDKMPHEPLLNQILAVNTTH